VLGHGRVATLHNVTNDRGYSRIDIFRALPFCVEQPLEQLLELGITREEGDRHQRARPSAASLRSTPSPVIRERGWRAFSPTSSFIAGEGGPSPMGWVGEGLMPSAPRRRSIHPPTSSGRVFSAGRLTIRRELTLAIASISTSPLARSVAPVCTRSTM